MIAHANLPISFWGDAMLTAAYILNCVPSKGLTATPYELWRVESRLWTTYDHGVRLAMYITQPINMKNLILELPRQCS